MRAEFRLLTLCDFKAFAGKHSLVLNGGGVVYITGVNEVTKRLSGNGASKSSLWDALTWCLYGRTAMGLRNTDVKPWRGGNPCVTVAVKIDDREPCIVQRSVNPNRFTIDGAEAPDIEALLPMSFELFTNTMLLPQDRPLFFDRSPKDKMSLFSETLTLDRWDTRSTMASKAAEGFELEIGDLLDEQRTSEGALEELDRQLADVRERAKKWADEARQRVRVSEASIKELQRKLELRENELATATLTEDGSLTEARHSEGEIRKLVGELLRWQKTLSTLRAQLAVAIDQRAETKADLAALSTARNCPTCDQAVKPSNLGQHKAHLVQRGRELEAAITAGQRAIVAATASASKCGKQADQLEDNIKSFRTKADEAGDVITRVRPEVAELKLRIESFRKTKDEVNPYTVQTVELITRRKKLAAVLESIKVDVGDAQHLAERTRFWVKGFKDIKLQLIEEVLQELELVANSMIEEVGLEDWQVRFSIEKESKSGSVQRMINVQISSPESKGFVRWESWSGGERQRLRLIGSLALADVLLSYAGIETNLEVLDEPAIYWASEGVQELCAFLATRAKEHKKDIFFIEHNTVESAYFDEVITVVKDKDGAYIEAMR